MNYRYHFGFLQLRFLHVRFRSNVAYTLTELDRGLNFARGSGSRAAVSPIFTAMYIAAELVQIDHPVIVLSSHVLQLFINISRPPDTIILLLVMLDL